MSTGIEIMVLQYLFAMFSFKQLKQRVNCVCVCVCLMGITNTKKSDRMRQGKKCEKYLANSQYFRSLDELETECREKE